MIILGISAFYHDSSICLIKDEEIIFAVQEERFSRIKHDLSFPEKSIKYMLENFNIKAHQIDYVAFYEKPFIKFERLLETYLAYAPRGFLSFIKSMPLWIKEKLFQKYYLMNRLSHSICDDIDWSKKIIFLEHHLSHASSAFFPSPFTKAAILTIDGVGEWTTTSIALGNKNNIKIIKEIYFPHSLGLLYSAFTFFLGFKVNSGEYKIMGLAPYGKPTYVNLIKKNLVNIQEDGSFQLNMKFFDYCTGNKMTNHHFAKLFKMSPRKSESALNQNHMDIASSIQKITEEIILKIGKHISLKTKQKNLCLAGGVALNCVANGVLLKSNYFENIWIQPASGDAGGAIGAAYGVLYLMQKKPRTLKVNKDKMQDGFLGPKYNEDQILEYLKGFNPKFFKLSEKELLSKVSIDLASGKAIGWMQGKAEFGPRSLGNRSILADPRSPDMQKKLNLKVKFRESFRPFAPSILINDISKWFEMKTESPYMLFVSKIKKSKKIKMNEKEEKLFGMEKLNIPRSLIPAVTHVDYTARVQTVDKNTNSKFYKLLKNFKKITGVPILVNTSFNIRGEPIVCDPKDAYKCFMSSDIDVLVIENFYFEKKLQNKKFLKNYKNCFQLD